MSKLIDISKESIGIGEEIIPLIDNVPHEDYVNFKPLVYKLLIIAQDMVSSNNISFNKLAQKNYEYLDTLNAVIHRFLGYSESQLPADRSQLGFFKARINGLIIELNASLFLHHQNRITTEPSDEFLQDHESDEDLTEPCGVS